MERNELKTLGLSSGLVLLNIVLMGVLALTPANRFTAWAFQIPILGVLIFGALITAGVYIAKRGIRNDSSQSAVAGTGILQFAYGVFGAGIIATYLSPGLYAPVLAVTAVVSTGIALLAGLLVYLTGHDFSNWRKYSNYMFMGVFLFALIGSLTPTVLLIAFPLALAGFFTYLVYEIWDMKQRPGRTYMNSIGIYVAFMGVFVQVLQIIIQMYAEE